MLEAVDSSSTETAHATRGWTAPVPRFPLSRNETGGDRRKCLRNDKRVVLSGAPPVSISGISDLSDLSSGLKGSSMPYDASEM